MTPTPADDDDTLTPEHPIVEPDDPDTPERPDRPERAPRPDHALPEPERPAPKR